MTDSRLHLVGLTGGVASGKSVVASQFVHLKIPVINLDDIGRSLLANRSVLWDELAALCGPSILESGKLDRKKMRTLIFADAALREKVETLLHPLIWDAFLFQSSTLHKQGHTVVVCEAALIVESALHDNFEELVVVTAPANLRKERLIKRDSVDETLAEQILQAQLEETERNAKGTVILTNHGSEKDLRDQVNDLVEKWKAKGWL